MSKEINNVQEVEVQEEAMNGETKQNVIAKVWNWTKKTGWKIAAGAVVGGSLLGGGYLLGTMKSNSSVDEYDEDDYDSDDDFVEDEDDSE